MHFNFDNKFFTGLSKLVDAVVLSIIWIVCCLPIFTIGAASTALYYTVHKSIMRSRGYIMESFFHSFKTNFKQATLTWLIQLVVIAVLGFDIFTMSRIASQQFVYTVFFCIFIVMAALVIMWVVYTIAYQARFTNTVKFTLKNAAVIMIANLPWSVLILLIVAGAILSTYLVPFLIFVWPAVICILFNLILEKIFRKYMNPEDLKEQEESDQIDLK